jgi:hypothetical protein
VEVVAVVVELDVEEVELVTVVVNARHADPNSFL